MSKDKPLLLIASSHPDPIIAEHGFDLQHPYIEQCWAQTVGPTATLLLRRLPDMWRFRQPASTTVGEIASTLGVTPSAMRHGLRQLEAHYFTNRLSRDGHEVYATVAPLSADLLERAPITVRHSHSQLITPALRPIVDAPTCEPATSPIANIARRLNRLQTDPGPGLTR